MLNPRCYPGDDTDEEGLEGPGGGQTCLQIRYLSYL